MTKTKKVMIGVVSMFVLIPLFWGVHYFYVIYNTEDISSYYNYCSQLQGPGGDCINDFIRKCEDTGGEMVKKERCSILPPPSGAHCLAESSSLSFFKYSRCCSTNNVCKCSFGKGWDNQEGCKFL